MKKMIFACAALSLLAACQSSPKKTESQNTENAFVVLNDNDVTQKKDVKLSELTEDFRIIRMDNRDEALFQFGGAYFSDNYICIKQRRAQAPLKLFDKTGKFLCDVGSVGQGPGEYTSIYDALIDEKNGNIYVAPFAWNPRILKYGFDGKFKGEITLKGNINKGKLYLQPDGTLSMVHLCFQDLDGTFTGANIQPNDTSRTQYVFHKSVASNFRDAGGMNVGFNNEIWSYRNTDTFSFQTTFNDTVYHYDVANNQMTPRFLYAMNPDIDQYISDLDVTVNYIRENFPDKKIVGYLWPQYYNLESNEYYQQFMTTDVWMKMLEACYERLDGVVIWSHGKGENGEDVAWTDGRVQDIYNTTKQFISNHAANIKLDTSEQSGDITREPSEFYVYECLNFTNTPDDLLKFGLQPINYVKEADLSEKDPDVLAPGEPNPPVLSRITKVGESVTRPVLINQSTWIGDRSSNNAAMVERFKSVYETFHAANDVTTIGYKGVGPTALTALLLGSYETEFARMDSWLRYAVEPTRVLRQYADILYLDVVMVNDDIELWKSDTRTVLEEARNGLPAGKKIYACIGAVYNHRKADFPKAYQPVDEEILLEAMEFLYLRCDGIVLIGNCQDSDPVTYSENISVMKAAKTFYENHKAVIDKTLPDEPIIGTEIPEFSDEDLPPVELREEILNGGFEEEITPHSVSPVVHTNALVRPLRLAGFFNTTSMSTFPDATAGTTVPDGTWFHRCSNNSWFWFTYIDDTELQYTGGGTPIAHTGTKSAVVYTAFGATSQYADHKDNMEHLFSLAQTLSLDDTKTYKLTFWYNRPALVWGTSNVAANLNNIEEMRVGIVSSTGATNTTDTTYEETITLDKSGNWVECSVTFDLPKIISENPGISFGKCAIHFNPVPVLNESGQTVKCLVNIDDVSLTVLE